MCGSDFDHTFGDGEGAVDPGSSLKRMFADEGDALAEYGRSFALETFTIDARNAEFAM